MSYEISVKGGGANITISGFSLLAPFSFNDGNHALRPDLTVFIIHIVRNVNNNATFQKSTALLNSNRDFEIKDSSGNIAFTLSDFPLTHYIPQVGVGCDEAIVIMNGGKSVISAVDKVTLPPHEFPDWKFDSPGLNRFSGGCMVKNHENNELLKAAVVNPIINLRDRSLDSLSAFGPSKGGSSVLSTLLGSGKNLKQDDSGNVNPDYSGGPLSSITIEDKRRSSEIHLFGGDGYGKSQVNLARGAAILSQGTFSKAGAVDRMENLAKFAYGDGDVIDLKGIVALVRGLLNDPGFNPSMLLSTAVGAEQQNLFEGIYVWDLKPRKTDGQAQEVGAPFL